MIVFFGGEMKVAIPASRITHILQHGKLISLYYESGEYENIEGSVLPRIDKLTFNYDSKEIAEDVMRAFYVACESNKGAYYFGN